MKHFIYDDDLAITTQGKTSEEEEENLNVVLNNILLYLYNKYYNDMYLKPNPAKTQITVFHLRSRDAKWKLRVNWKGTVLEYCTKIPRH